MSFVCNIYTFMGVVNCFVYYCQLILLLYVMWYESQSLTTDINFNKCSILLFSLLCTLRPIAIN